MKRNSMARWMNLHQNNIFVNRMRLPLLCEKSGAILLVLVGRLAGRQEGGLANAAFNEGTVLPTYFSPFFGRSIL